MRFFTGFFFLPFSSAANEPVFVLYPEAPEPYRQAFHQLIAGIVRTVGGPVQKTMMASTAKGAHVQDWLENLPDQATVILLGQPTDRLLAIRQAHPIGQRIFVSGLIAFPGQIPWPGVSLIVDPTLYVQALHDLVPDIGQVIAFYNAQDQAWVPLAEQAAASVGLKIETVAVADAVSAVRKIAEVLKTVDSKTTALWFATNTLDLDTELLFPFVLEQAWEQKIVVFSETITHAKRGFLFAFYPDYSEVGAELGRRIQQGADGQTAGFTLTRAARWALNHRTARRLGIFLRDEQIKRADVLFPQP